MKRLILIFFICLGCMKGFAQEEETFIEEKSSDWVKVTAPPRVATPSAPVSSATPAPSRRPPGRQPAVEPKESDAFEKANKKVKRFKKSGSDR